MRDTMHAFEKIAGSTMAPIILLFTKKDIFVEHLKILPFTDFFPEYIGSLRSSDICAHLALEFRRLGQRPGRRLDIHFLNATDPENFREVFEDMKVNMFGSLLNITASEP